MVQSPFRVGGPVTGEYFTDRADEVGEILRALRQPTRMLIRGARRQGKTSAIAQAGRRFRHEGGILLWADLSTMATLADLRDRLLSSLPSGFFGVFEGLQKLVPFLEIVVADPATGAQAYRFRPGVVQSHEPGVREQIRILLESIQRRREALDKPMAIVLDEVQAILSVEESGTDWYLRDLMQGTPDLSWICAGSQPSVLEAMASGKDAAFFDFFSPGPRFDPIDKDHLATWIAHRMEEAGVGCEREAAWAIVNLAVRTQDIIQLADEVFLHGSASGAVSESEMEAALLSLVRKHQERFLRVWGNLTANQRIALRGIASGIENLYAHDSGIPMARSSLHRAVEALHTRGILADGVRPEEIDDPFFREWILRFAMPNSVPETLL